MVLVAAGFFLPMPRWNQNARYALTRALVEDGSIRIDRFHHTTGDKAFREGHFYCDKAPGASWVAVPAYAAFAGIRALASRPSPRVTLHPLDPNVAPTEDLSRKQPGDRVVYDRAFMFGLYVCGLFAAAIPAAALAAALTRWFEARNVNHAGALGALAVLGTPLWVYSTAMYGHVLAAAALGCAWLLVQRGGGAATSMAVGALLSLAVVTEYPAAVAAVVVWLVHVYEGHGRSAWWSAAAALPLAGALARYHHAAFGSVLATGYDYVYLSTFAEGMKVHYGLSWPRVGPAYALTFGSYRGLFYLSPVLLLGTWGLVAELRERRGRARVHAAVSLALALYFVALASGYYMWNGGAAAGPRHVLPAVVFLALGWPRARSAAPLLFGVLACVSVWHGLLLACGGPEAPEFGDPIYMYAMARAWELRGPVDLAAIAGVPRPVSVAGLVAALWGMGRWTSPRPKRM